MAQYKTNFIDIDPDNCTKEEFEEALNKLHNLSGYFESKQLAIKLFINSVYGSCASKYFVGHNTAVAESITLQGQDLNHYSENCVNKYFRGIFQSEKEYNKVIYVPLFDWMEKWNINDTDDFYAKDANKNWVLINLPIAKSDILSKTYSDDAKMMLKKVFVKTTLGKHLGITYEQAKSIDINKGRVTEQLPLTHKSLADKFKYLDKETYLEDDPSISMTIAGDTDSVSHDAIVYLDNEKMTVEDAFNKCKIENRDTVLVLQNGQELIPASQHTTKAFDPAAPLLPVDRPIKYFMRHKVSKPMFKITTEDGKEVVVTEDHSCMVIRDNNLIELTVKEINLETDRLVEIK